MTITTSSEVDIISRALVLLGERPVSDITDDARDSIAKAVAMIDALYQEELSAHRWRFAAAKAQLSQVNAQPLNEWRYVHQLPSDAVHVWRVYPATDYEIYGDRIYSNKQDIEVDYTFRPPYNKLPDYFTLLLTYRLAANLARTISGSNTKVQEWTQFYEVQYSRATFADSSRRPNRFIEDSPFTDVR